MRASCACLRRRRVSARDDHKPEGVAPEELEKLRGRVEADAATCVGFLFERADHWLYLDTDGWTAPTWS